MDDSVEDAEELRDLEQTLSSGIECLRCVHKAGEERQGLVL